MKEIRVFGINPISMNDYDERVIDDLSNDDFMQESEKQGFIWSLAGFTYDFNGETVPYDLYIRFIIVESSEDPKHIAINYEQDMRDFIYK